MLAVILEVLAAMDVVLLVILKVFEAISVGNVVIVVEATPPTLFTVAAPVTSAVPLNVPLV